MKPFRPWRIFFLVVAVLFFPQLAWAGPLNLGSINSKEPRDEIKKFWPLASYLAKELQSDGIDSARVVVAENIPAMATFLQEGKVDLYIDSPFPSVAVSHLSGSRFLLRRWKKGIGEYHTVIFTRKDSGISRLEDLQGKVIAFEEPYSSSGYFFPKIVLIEEGLRLVAKKNASNSVGRGEVGYVFSYDDESTMVWVLRGKVSAGAIDNQNYLKKAGKSLDSLKIIHRTFSFPRHIVSYRSDLSPKLVARIKEVLIKMDQSEEGRKALKDFEKTTKFDELPDQAVTPLLQARKFIAVEIGLQSK